MIVIKKKRKILGFRSGRLWKKVLASIFYFFVLMILVIAIIPTSSKDEKVETAKDSKKEEVIVDVDKEGDKVDKAEDTLKKLETEYLNEIVKQTSIWSESWTSLSNLLANPQIGNDSWTLQVVGVLIKMEGVTEEARALKAPERFKEINGFYLKAVEKYQSTPKLLPKAIDNQDVDIIDGIIRDMENGNEYINEATRLIGEMLK